MTKKTRRRWTVRQKKQAGDIFWDKPLTNEEMRHVLQFLEYTKGHKAYERARKRRRVPRVWPKKTK